MREASSHGGVVRLKIPTTPEVATACNCSLCRRIGGTYPAVFRLKDSMYTRPCAAAIAALAISGCAITQQVEPVKLAETQNQNLCVVRNSEVVQDGFHDVYLKVLERKGFRVDSLPDKADVQSCRLLTTYEAIYRWDLAIYLARADLRVFSEGKEAGRAVYDSLSGSSFEQKRSSPSWWTNCSRRLQGLDDPASGGRGRESHVNRQPGQPGGLLDVHLGAVKRCDAAHDRPAEPAAALFAAGHAKEALAQAAELRLVQPRPVVFDLQVHAALARLHPHQDAGRCRAVAHRVVQQVANEHRQQRGVAHHVAGRRRRQHQGLVFGKRSGCNVGRDLAGQLAEFNRLCPQALGIGA
jgi:hypothetical protein